MTNFKEKDTILHMQPDHSLLPHLDSDYLCILFTRSQNHVLHQHPCHLDCVLLGRRLEELLQQKVQDNLGPDRSHATNVSRHSDVRSLPYHDNDSRVSFDSRFSLHCQFPISIRLCSQNVAVDSSNLHQFPAKVS